MASINKREGLSFIQYESDGIQQNYTFNFKYISKDYIEVRVDDQNYTDFTFVNANEVRLGTAAPLGIIVTVRRVTDSLNKLVDFVDGGIITENLLDTQFDQVIDLVQEAKDVANQAIFINLETKTGDVAGVRMINVGDPVDPQDAVNLRTMDASIQVFRDEIDADMVAINNTKIGFDAKYVEIKAIEVDYNLKYGGVVQIGIDAEADKVQTGLDRVQTGLDVIASDANADRAEASESIIQGLVDTLTPMVPQFPQVKLDVDQLKLDMDAVEGDIITLESQRVTDSGNITTLQGDLGLLEDAVVGTEQDILDLQNDVVYKTGVQTVEDKVLTNPSIQNPSRVDMKQDTLANLTTYALTATNGQLVFATDSKETFVVKDGQLSAVGGGSSGGINYILNPEADTNINGWATYKDATSTDPTIGTGGTSTFTFTRETSSPLRGSASFLLTKPASDVQGEGFSYDFTIDNADKGKVLQGSFDYQIASGTLLDDAMTVWIYDITNSRLIQPAPTKLKNSGIIERFPFEFQTSIDSTSYRLIVHQSSAVTTACTIKFDNFKVGPTAKLYGSTSTTPVTATYTLTNAGNATVTGTVSRNGAYATFEGMIIIGSTLPTSNILLNIPAGYSIVGQNFKLSNAVAFIGTTYYSGSAYSSSATAIGFAGPSMSGVWSPSVPATWANTNTIRFNIVAQIQGWSSSQIMSSDADTRVVAFASNTKLATGTLTAAFNTAILPSSTSDIDTHACYNSSTGLYTVKVPGIYNVSGYLQINHASTGLNAISYATIRKNGTDLLLGTVYINNTSAVRTTVRVEGTVSAVAGDTLALGSYTSNTTPTYGNDNSGSGLNIRLLSGPSQIMASETVAARYITNAGQAITAMTSTVINYATKEYDTHNAVTTGSGVWRFTAPVSGIYSVNALTTKPTSASTNIAVIGLHKNGVFVASGEQKVNATSVGTLGSILGTNVQLLAGDYIDIRMFSNGGPLVTTAGYNHISIVRVGNY